MKTSYLYLRSLLALALSITAFLSAHAQEYVFVGAIAFDRFEQVPIADARVGFKGKEFGAYTDEKGYFNIAVPNELIKPNDTLGISAPGYYDWNIPAQSLRGYFAKNETVLLTPFKREPMPFDTTDTKKVVLGSMQPNFYGSVPLNKVLVQGSELATRINVPYGPARLNEVAFEVKKNTADSVRLRLHIYDIKNGMPHTELLNRSIYHTITAGVGRQTIGLSNDNLVINGDLAVSLEVLGIYGEVQDIELAMGENGNTVFTRHNGQANWSAFPGVGMAFGIGLQVNAETDDVATTIAEGQLVMKTLKAKGAKTTGRVMLDGKPVQGVRVRNKSNDEVVGTNARGEYAINAEYGDILVTDFFTLKPKSIVVSGSTNQDFEVKPKYEKLDEVTVTEKKLDAYGEELVPTPFGLKKRASIGGAGTLKTKEELGQVTISIGQMIRGRFPGLLVAGRLHEETFSSTRGLGGPVALIVDGVLVNSGPGQANPLDFLNPNSIESVYFIPGVSAAIKYGSGARGGALMFTTSSNALVRKDRKSMALAKNNEYKETEELVDLASTTPDIAEKKPGSFVLTGSVSVKGKPVQGVKIGIKGTLEATQSNQNGAFSIDAKIGDVVTTSFFSLRPSATLIEDEVPLKLELSPKYTQLNEVTVSERPLETAGEESMDTGIGDQKRRSLGYAVASKTKKELPKGATSLGRYLAGQFPGLNVSGMMYEETYSIRGENSLVVSGQPLFVVDKIPFTTPPNFLDPNTIIKATVINGLAGATRYGSLGKGGVIIIETIAGQRMAAGETNEPPSLLVKGNTYQNEALGLLEGTGTDLLVNLGETDTDIDVLKARAMVYEVEGKYAKSLDAYKKIAQLRPDRVQSYLDLARTYVTVGDHKKAYGLYKTMLTGRILGATLDADIIKIVETEVRHLATKHRSRIPFKELPVAFLEKALKIDTRIVFDWNVPSMQFELQFVNPQKKFHLWGHTYEKSEERLLNEINNGYQTEEFLIDDHQGGTWQINVENEELEEYNMPLLLKYTVYKNYGTPNETKQVKLIELSKLDRKAVLDRINQDGIVKVD